ncbi:MAG: hypothetical protein QGF68_17355 [Nitrospinota bacterium]|jgi:hypothetical protein|nr:hypothetical protein [Nitrospinota bacterium]MDP7386990.1 hypothetical protein [Nitrospinota bacterium]
MQILARSIERLDPDAAKRFRFQIEDARKIAEPAAKDDEEPDRVAAG